MIGEVTFPAGVEHLPGKGPNLPGERRERTVQRGRFVYSKKGVPIKSGFKTFQGELATHS